MKEQDNEATVAKLEAQLGLWRLKIDDLVAKTQLTAVPATFDALMYIDELKALHAIAQSRFDEFRAARAPERARLKSKLKRAWKDLDVAFKHSKPSP
jgi:hypothetical protein